MNALTYLKLWKQVKVVCIPRLGKGTKCILLSEVASILLKVYESVETAIHLMHFHWISYRISENSISVSLFDEKKIRGQTNIFVILRIFGDKYDYIPWIFCSLNSRDSWLCFEKLVLKNISREYVTMSCCWGDQSFLEEMKRDQNFASKPS